MIDPSDLVDYENKMVAMLKKGDQLRPQYDQFDFSKLSSLQLFWLKQMGWFTVFRKRIERQFEVSEVSNELKILFI